MDVDDVTTNLRKFYVKAYLGVSPKQAPKYWLLFQVSVPPLGWSTYFISKATRKGIVPFPPFLTSVFFLSFWTTPFSILSHGTLVKVKVPCDLHVMLCIFTLSDDIFKCILGRHKLCLATLWKVIACDRREKT